MVLIRIWQIDAALGHELLNTGDKINEVHSAQRRASAQSPKSLVSEDFDDLMTEMVLQEKFVQIIFCPTAEILTSGVYDTLIRRP